MPESNYIVDGNIYAGLFKLSWPVMVAFLIHFSFNIADTIFVAKLGADYIAAVTYCFPIIFMIFALAQGLAIGSTALVAQYIGARNKKAAANVAEHSLLIAIFLTILITAPILIFQKRIFLMMGADPLILNIVLQYSTIVFGAFGVVFVAFIANSVLRGIGDMRTPMKAMALTSLFNIVLDPILIFGLGPFPRMGIVGAAVATVISRLVMVVYLLIKLFSKRKQLPLTPRLFKFRPSILLKILSIGSPASAAAAIRALAGAAIMGFVSIYGSMAVAAWGIVFRIESVIMLPIFAIGTAAVTMIGQNLGAGKEDRAGLIAKRAILLSVVPVTFLGILILNFPAPLIRIFIVQADVLKFGIMYFNVLALSYPLLGIYFVGVSILQGSGHVAPVVGGAVLRWGTVLGISFALKSLIVGNIMYFFYILLGGTLVSSIFVGYVLMRGKWKRAVVRG